MKYHLVQFHYRSIIVAPARTAESSGVSGVMAVGAFVRPSRLIASVFAASLAMFGIALVFGYGRTIWAHAAYYTRGVAETLTVSEAAKNRLPAAAGAVYAESTTVRLPRPAPLPLAGELTMPLLATVDAPLAQAAKVAPAPVTKKSATPAGKPTTVGELYIAKLRVRVPIVAAENNLNAINGALAYGTVQWPGSVEAGDGGTTIILGHSSAPLSYRGKYGAVFSLLEKLQAGDVITVQAPGALYTYTVRDQLIIDPKKEKPDLLKQETETLMLVSCWPVGTNWQRIVIRAERTS